jgi:hypothetical protein
VAKLVSRVSACHGSLLGSNPDISQKYNMGDISKGDPNTPKPAKKYTENIWESSWLCLVLGVWFGLDSWCLVES